ncbi:hypothetical protein [Crateriforma conspicua]|uniref:hypothetical protein n=1 Tax=Crateriforma conspicua TaxID=2527996 RepID=UPI0013FD013D|nr:hypothetical protein [Crateriforma conspicua]
MPVSGLDVGIDRVITRVWHAKALTAWWPDRGSRDGGRPESPGMSDGRKFKER